MFSLVNKFSIGNISINLFKKEKQILFIDDEIDEFEIPNLLKENGYKVDIMNDAENIEHAEIERAKIIFVDFKGVGKRFNKKEQGIALIKALKSKYRKKKTVILYSSNSFDLRKDIDCADDRIYKGAELQQFIDMIEKYI